MSLSDKINADIKAAMLAKEKEKLQALRSVKSAIMMELTKGADSEISPEMEIKILSKLVKQRKESAEIYQNNGREDTAKEELFEAQVIQAYLPAMMSEEELKSALKAIIAEVGASSPADMGKVMGVATKKLAGKAEGKAISMMVKQLLA